MWKRRRVWIPTGQTTMTSMLRTVHHRVLRRRPGRLPILKYSVEFVRFERACPVASAGVRIPLAQATQSEEPEMKLIQPCRCTGTLSYVHIQCLNTWYGLIRDVDNRLLLKHTIFLTVCKPCALTFHPGERLPRQLSPPARCVTLSTRWSTAFGRIFCRRTRS